MNNSAPDYSSRSAESTTRTARPKNLNSFAMRAHRRGAADQLRGVPVETSPLLKAQRLAFESAAVLCVCENYRAAQKHFCEANSAFSETAHQPVLIHEMMPLYQQTYLLNCLRAMSDYAVDCHPVVFTSARFYRQMLVEAPEVVAECRTIEIGNPVLSAVDAAAAGDDEPSITCICLRVGAGGRWVLMDHEEAAVASPTDAPSADLARRLVNHTVQITGRRLAPYLAMMFDVPMAWKFHAELAQCALLVFRDDECVTGCTQPGIPPKILWNDVLGIICSD